MNFVEPIRDKKKLAQIKKLLRDLSPRLYMRRKAFIVRPIGRHPTLLPISD